MSGRVIWVGLLAGALLNVTGWLGNVFLLGDLWDEAVSAVPTTPWRDTIWRHVLSFAPDFIYGLVMAWLYRALSQRFGSTFKTALLASGIVFVIGVFTTYLGVANSGLLPWKISALTTLLALVTFVPAAYLVHRALSSRQ